MAVDADPPDGELNESTTATPNSAAAADADEAQAEHVEMDTVDADTDTAADAEDAEDAGGEAADAEDAGGEAHDAEDADAEAADYDAEADAADDGEPATKPSRFAMSHPRLAVAVGLVVVLSLGGLVGWLAFRTYESRQAQEQRQLFLQAGRQGAINLTTLDWQDADAGVQRILDSATGTFYADFSKRSQPFVDVLTQTQSKTEGTITDAGLESVSGDEAQVLVAVKVQTSNMAEPEQEPRFWRMRLSVQKVGDNEAKVSKVAFIP